ncbi:hypothetical protein GGX14DRAFT_372251, partial [Mycena pura]
SAARITHLKECLDEVIAQMENPRGVHPKLAKILDGLANKVEDVGGELAQDRKRRTNARTWKDNTANTMYLD